MELSNHLLRGQLILRIVQFLLPGHSKYDTYAVEWRCSVNVGIQGDAEIQVWSTSVPCWVPN